MKLLFTVLAIAFSAQTVSASTFERIRPGFADVKPRKNESITSAAVRKLNSYGKKALKRLEVRYREDLLSRGVDISLIDPLALNRRVHVLEDQCFDSPNPLKRREIKSEREFRSVVNQVESAALFLKDFAVSMRGGGLSLYKVNRIDICVKNTMDPVLVFSNQTLRINMSNRIRWYSGLSRDSISKKWNDGDHLEWGSPEAKLWKILNPVGIARMGIRKVLGHRLEQLLDRFNSPDKKDYGKRQNFDRLLGEYVSLDLLSEEVKQKLEELSEEQRLQVIQGWRDFLSNPQNISDAETEATQQILDSVSRDLTKMEVNQTGVVNVNNFHKIKVSVSATKGKWSRFVKVVTDENHISVDQVGLVNVQTNDIINVNVGFAEQASDMIHIHAAAVTWALEQLQLRQELVF